MSHQANALNYQSGFGNEFSTEAIQGSLPQGQNSPQQVAHGLYAEQISGNAFTAPRSENRRTWTYRIRPAAMHGEFKEIPLGELASGPFDVTSISPNQLRWNPRPIPSQQTDFIRGLFTVAGNGSADSQSGIAIHLYAANTSMHNRFFYNADGEMLIVPQLGALSLRTAMSDALVDL